MRALPTWLPTVALIALLSGLLSTSGALLLAQEQKPQAQNARDPADISYSQYVHAKPGELTGTVLYADGKTPAAKVPVRLWSTEQGKFTQETSTDEKGAYKLSALAAGRYLVVFGDRVYVDLRVDDEATPAGGPLNIIIPRGAAPFGQMAPERRAAVLAGLAQPKDGESGEAGADKPLGTLIIIGGGTATAVAAVVVIDGLNDHDQEDHRWVSP
jgi:hypothetical protein